MKPENFVAFFTACGFFIGLAFSIASMQSAFEIVVFTCFITFMFYVFIHIFIINFIDSKNTNSKIFNKTRYEHISNSIITDLSLREKRMEYLLAKLNEERAELKKSEVKERRKNVKKRVA